MESNNTILEVGLAMHTPVMFVRTLDVGRPPRFSPAKGRQGKVLKRDIRPQRFAVRYFAPDHTLVTIKECAP